MLDQVSALNLTPLAHDDRPYVITNFALTLDGHATIAGRSGSIGSASDTAMLVGLRTRVDAVMIGAGTMRAERYGRIVSNPELRAYREATGLEHDPLAVIVSNRLDLPWDAPLFTDGGGGVVIFTASEDEAPETAIRRLSAVEKTGRKEKHVKTRSESAEVKSFASPAPPGIQRQAPTARKIGLTNAPQKTDWVLKCG